MIPFVERSPWRGPDLQTLRSQVRPLAEVPTGEPVVVALTDGTGDRMTGVLHRATGTRRPLVVLFHGLTGSADSAYMRAAAAHLVPRGFSVVRMNLRGAGSSAKSTSRYYHAGCVPELLEVLGALESHAPNGMVLVGHSLGGAMLVNLLAAVGDDARVVTAMTVSAPVDPFVAARRLQAVRNRLYQRTLLSKMKRDVLGGVRGLDERLRVAIRRCRTIEAFDDVFSGPFNGYSSGADYYRRTAAGVAAHTVRVPLLMVHAANDPWIPVEGYEVLQRSSPEHVVIEVISGGGHVGFHEAGHRVPWQVRRLETLLEAL